MNILKWFKHDNVGKDSVDRNDNAHKYHIKGNDILDKYNNKIGVVRNDKNISNGVNLFEFDNHRTSFIGNITNAHNLYR